MSAADLDLEQLLEQLVAIDSRNPDLATASPGERPLADFVADRLGRSGLEVTFEPVLGERGNVLAVLPARDSSATVVFEAHLDTVPAEPGTMRLRRDGRRVYGRGACDTKGSLAAMLGAAHRLAQSDGRRPRIIVAAVCDEEYIMRGGQALARSLPPADAVIVGEPTSLLPARAHNGFVRLSVTVVGVAAHSSRAELGTNAINQAAGLILYLDETIGQRLRASPDPLSGPTPLSATMIEGGTAPNVIPDRCTVWFDRRVSPSETPQSALDEIRSAVADFSAREAVRVDVAEPLIALGALDTSAEALAVRAAEQAASTLLGRPVIAGGLGYSTDACCFFDRPDLPAVVLGPGSIDQAHGEVEWIDLDEVTVARDIYVELAMNVATLRLEGDGG